MNIQNLPKITARDLARDQKTVIDNVLSRGKPVVVTHHNIPKVAIVDIKMLGFIEHENALRKTRNLINMGKEAEVIWRKLKIKGPKDLSVNHDKYTWGPHE